MSHSGHSNKRKLPLSSVTVDMGCHCRKATKLVSFLHPKPKFTSTASPCPSSSASSSSLRHHGSSGDRSYYSFRHLLDAESARKAPAKPVKGFGRIDDEGIAVEKDSDNPYLDFRHSMLQMILESGIYSKDDMRELLNCFLQLNSPYHHGMIVRAFTEIWNGVFSVRSPSVFNPYHRSSSPADNNINPYSGYYNKSSWEC